MELALAPLPNLLTSTLFPNDTRIAMKRGVLEQALSTYCQHVGNPGECGSSPFKTYSEPVAGDSTEVEVVCQEPDETAISCSSARAREPYLAMRATKAASPRREQAAFTLRLCSLSPDVLVPHQSKG